MVKIKKSFLEKLTGSSKIETEEYKAPQKIEPNNIFQEEQEETEMTLNESPNISREDLANAEEDGEGQLTIDVYQTDSDIVIKSTIAGVKPEDLDVSINNDMVTIKGERTNEEEVTDENYYYQECYWGGFSRSVILPVDVISDKSEASMKNGILTIRLPKADVNKTKKIQVRGF
jgi:HSP20 family protein